MAHSDQSETHHSGFILGLVAGAAITLFLTTKKGRQILHSLTDEGNDLLTEIEELLKDKVSDVKEKEEELRPILEKKVREVSNGVQEEVSKVVANLSDTIEQTIHEKVDKTLQRALAAVEEVPGGKAVEHEIKKLELIERAQSGVEEVEKRMDLMKEKLEDMEERIMESPEVKRVIKKRFFKRKKSA